MIYGEHDRPEHLIVWVVGAFLVAVIAVCLAGLWAVR